MSFQKKIGSPLNVSELFSWFVYILLTRYIFFELHFGFSSWKLDLRPNDLPFGGYDENVFDVFIEPFRNGGQCNDNQ